MRGCALLAVALLGCSQEQLVGYACPAGGCNDPMMITAPLGPCAEQYTTPVQEVEEEAELCWVYSLDTLGEPGEEIYLTRVQLGLTEFSHHVDIRLVHSEELDREAYPDGPLDDCDALWEGEESIVAEPLLATEDSAEPWDFSDAPLVITTSHRLMINQHYINSSVGGGVARVSVSLNLECVREPPPVVTQSFLFVRQELEELSVGVGETATLCSSCNFKRDVKLRRLFRRTHKIDQFNVLLGDTPLWTEEGDGPCVRDPFNPWRCEFEEPVPVEHTDVLEWACTYRNDAAQSDRPIRVGAGTDACSLMGHYSLPSGGVDGDEQTCTRRSRAAKSACPEALFGGQ